MKSILFLISFIYVSTVLEDGIDYRANYLGEDVGLNFQSADLEFKCIQSDEKEVTLTVKIKESVDNFGFIPLFGSIIAVDQNNQILFLNETGSNFENGKLLNPEDNTSHTDDSNVYNTENGFIDSDNSESQHKIFHSQGQTSTTIKLTPLLDSSFKQYFLMAYSKPDSKEIMVQISKRLAVSDETGESFHFLNEYFETSKISNEFKRVLLFKILNKSLEVLVEQFSATLKEPIHQMNDLSGSGTNYDTNELEQIGHASVNDIYLSKHSILNHPDAEELDKAVLGPQDGSKLYVPNSSTVSGKTAVDDSTVQEHTSDVQEISSAITSEILTDSQSDFVDSDPNCTVLQSTTDKSAVQGDSQPTDCMIEYVGCPVDPKEETEEIASDDSLSSRFVLSNDENPDGSSDDVEWLTKLVNGIIIFCLIFLILYAISRVFVLLVWK